MTPSFQNNLKVSHFNKAWYEESIREENEFAEADEAHHPAQQLYGLAPLKKKNVHPSCESLENDYRSRKSKSPISSTKQSVQNSLNNPKFKITTQKRIIKNPYGNINKLQNISGSGQPMMQQDN